MKRKNYLSVFLMLFSLLSLTAQNRTVSGVVTNSADNEPIIGASVVVKGVNRGVITDIDGKYSLSVPEESKTLVFTFIGMKPVVADIANKQVVNVTMIENVHNLDEVVVGALGIKRDAKALAYSRQKIDADALNENKSNDMAAGLAGKIAGLNVVEGATNTSSSRIVIRGSNSITGNNQPLFVIDGVPVESGGAGNEIAVTNGGGLDYGSGSSQINPENIENIEVLKGPNAAALYGSRAANGVVIITTKKSAADGKSKVSIASNTQIQTVRQYPDYQNVYGAGSSFLLDNLSSVKDAPGSPRLPDLRNFYRSWGAPMLGQQVIDLDGSISKYDPNPKNVRDFYKESVSSTNSVTVEGGDKSNNYRFNLQHLYSNSPIDKMNILSRQTIGAVFVNTLAKDLVLDSRITYVNESVKNRQYINGNNKNPIYQFVNMTRNLSIDDYRNYKDANGNESGVFRDFMNPFWAINENFNQDKKNRFNTSFNLNYTMTSNLSAVAKFGSELMFLNGFEFDNMGAKSDLNGLMMTISNKMANNNLEGFLMFSKKDGLISVTANAGLSQVNQFSEMRTQRTNAVLLSGWQNIANSAEPVESTQAISNKRINAIFASTNFGYNNIFFLDLTARNDWSSTLPDGNNSYFYPSIGGSLLFSELFDIDQRTLPLGKLRSSYAIVGNDTKPYRLENRYSTGGIVNNYQTATISTLRSEPNLLPEKTKSFEAGTELKFFSNRLGIDFTYYNTRTSNQILTAQLSASSGYNDRVYNAGEVRNNGVEIVITAQPIKSTNFNWTTTLNFAKNNSLVYSLLDSISSFKLQTFGTVGVFAEVGQPYGVLKGRNWKFDSQGRKLVNADGTAMFVEDQIIGNASPKFTCSFNNTFKWYAIDFSFLIDAKVGGSLFSGTANKGNTNGLWASTLEGRNAYYVENIIYGRNSTNLNLQGGIMIDGYFADGTKNNVYLSPQSYFQTGANGVIDAMSVYDASFVKLRQMTIGYNVPTNVAKKLHLNNLRIALVGRNLWNFYQATPKGIDPESSATAGNGQGIENGALPPMANLGLNINFSF